MTIHDVNTYAELGALAPEPDEPDEPDEPEDGNCAWCGQWYCTPDCKPRFVSPYLAARSRERLENGDPES